MSKLTNDKKSILNPITASVGAAAMAAAMTMGTAQASESPFATTDLSSGFMLAGKNHEGKCGEGKCGEGKKGGEGKCGEGKCGGDSKKGGEGKCGEGKCGGA